MVGERHIQRSAALRGQRRFQEAIDEILNNRGNLSEVTLVPGLIQAFLAAAEMGDTELARNLAKEIAVYEPELPSIQRFLP